MEAIKKKMQALKVEKDNATDKVEAMENVAREADNRVMKDNEELAALKNQLSKLESEYKVASELLDKTNATLETREKTLTAVNSFKNFTSGF